MAYTLVAPADGKHLDAILKLIQKPIEYLEAGTRSTAPAEADEGAEERPARPARSRRGGPRTRADAEAGGAEPKARGDKAPADRPRPDRTRPKAEAAASPEAAEAEQAKPEAAPDDRRGLRQQRGRGRQRPQDEAIDSNEAESSSPFGNDGPVPAFLLRSTRIAS